MNITIYQSTVLRALLLKSSLLYLIIDVNVFTLKACLFQIIDLYSIWHARFMSIQNGSE